MISPNVLFASLRVSCELRCRPLEEIPTTGLASPYSPVRLPFPQPVRLPNFRGLAKKQDMSGLICLSAPCRNIITKFQGQCPRMSVAGFRINHVTRTSSDYITPKSVSRAFVL